MGVEVITRADKYLLLIVIAITTFIKVFISNKTIIKLFCVKNKRPITMFMIQSILLSISWMFIPNPYYKAVNIVMLIIIYMLFLNMTIEKAVLAEEINVILITIIESIMAKLYIAVFSRIFSVQSNNFGLIFKSSIVISSVIIKLVLYEIIKHKNIKINIEDCVGIKEKLSMTVTSVISTLLIVITETVLVNNISKVPTGVFIMINILLISFFAIVLNELLETSEIDNVKKQKEDLEINNEILQENYDSLRSFRHDFNNIMQGIGGYIALDDMEGLRKMYNSILKECQDINNNIGINKEVINNPAIYNLINSKIKTAKKEDIQIEVSVFLDLENLKIQTYDLCRMLGILIDNAIEATKECEEKVITIKFLKDKFNDRDLIIIENPCKNYLLDIGKIYDKGFTTKKDSKTHGLGLWKVKQILKKNKNVKIYTARDKKFKQQLEIY